jgi:bifunctional non-homologous end joining protein LigD
MSESPRQVSARKSDRPRAAASRKRAISKRGAKTSVRTSADDALPELPFEATNLDKVMFPHDGYSKRDLFHYYVRVAPQILPVMRDRPLALKRYPGGIGAPFFFQQNAPAADSRPRGVRVVPVRVAAEGGSLHPRIVGGTLATLLYTVQLGCIEVDPWLVRLPSLDSADYSVIDLDPAPDLPFERVVEVANWVHDALEALGLHGVPKTTGSRGIHIFIPLPLRTSNDTSFKLARLVANTVATSHPRAATVERELDRRPPRSVYVDFVQNARGKTVAAAYCVRPVDGARVSMPLAWTDLTPDLDHRAFTIATAGRRIDRVGDLWGLGLARRNSAAAVRDALRRA